MIIIKMRILPNSNTNGNMIHFSFFIFQLRQTWNVIRTSGTVLSTIGLELFHAKVTMNVAMFGYHFKLTH